MQQSQWLLGVRDLVGHPGQMRESDFEVTSHEEFGTPLIGVSEDTPVELELKLESVHEGILVTGNAQTTLTGECSKCLKRS